MNHKVEDDGVSQILIAEGEPLRDTWEKYKVTSEYKNTRHWAKIDKHLDGSLWAAFAKGWHAAFNYKQDDA